MNTPRTENLPITAEALQIAIAKALGWEAVYGQWYSPESIANARTLAAGTSKAWCTFASPSKLPDYLNDLNAMHEAEKVLKDEDMEHYCLALHTLRVNQGIPTHTNGWRNLGIVHATAAQRAEAFARTLSLI